MELVRDLRTINIFATFENDLRKKCGLESTKCDFQCAKLENAKKFRHFAAMIKLGTYVNQNV